MSITVKPARLRDTNVFVYEAEDNDGDPIHVVGISLRANDLQNGDNAVIVPLPAAAGTAIVVQMAGQLTSRIISDIVRTARTSSGQYAQILDEDRLTTVPVPVETTNAFVCDATDFAEKVAAHTPGLMQELDAIQYLFLEEEYLGSTFLVIPFSSIRATDLKVIVRYRPTDRHFLAIPTSTGAIGYPSDARGVDEKPTLIVGSCRARFSVGQKVEYTIQPKELAVQMLLPRQVFTLSRAAIGETKLAIMDVRNGSPELVVIYQRPGIRSLLKGEASPVAPRPSAPPTPVVVESRISIVC